MLRKEFPGSTKLKDAALSGGEVGIKVHKVLEEKGMNDRERAAATHVMGRVSRANPNLSFDEVSEMGEAGIESLKSMTNKRGTALISKKAADVLKKLLIKE